MRWSRDQLNPSRHIKHTMCSTVTHTWGYETHTYFTLQLEQRWYNKTVWHNLKNVYWCRTKGKWETGGGGVKLLYLWTILCHRFFVSSGIFNVIHRSGTGAELREATGGRQGSVSLHGNRHGHHGNIKQSSTVMNTSCLRSTQINTNKINADDVYYLLRWCKLWISWINLLLNKTREVLSFSFFYAAPVS